MDKRHDTDCDAKKLYPSLLRLLACKWSLERTGVMGGTKHDTSLQKRQGAAVADLAAPINPNLSLIPLLCLHGSVLTILQKCFTILCTACHYLPFYKLVN